MSTDAVLGRAAGKRERRRASCRAQSKHLLTHGADEFRLERFRDAVRIGRAQFIDRVDRVTGDGEKETERKGRLREPVKYEEVGQGH